MKKVHNYAMAFVLVFFLAAAGQAQEASPPANAFTNVTIHTTAGETIEGGTIVWRNGVIEAVGEDVSIPFDAYVIDGGDSLHVYPGFIDGMALWGSPDRPEVETPDHPGNPGYKRAGIQPQRQPHVVLTEDDAFEEAQKLGFTTAAIGLTGEMLPGQVDLFFINGDGEQYLYEAGIGILAQFEGARGAAYPSTTMGIMAKYNQLWYNAKALQAHMNYFEDASNGYPAPERSPVLEALFPVIDNDKPLYFVADSEEYIERVFWLEDEMKFDFVLVSGEAAYEKAELLNENNIPVLASIDMPEEPEWRTEQQEEEEEPEISEEEITEEERIFRQRQLEAYEADIANVKELIESGVTVGYASNGMELDEFRDHLLTLHEDAEVSSQQILNMLTVNAANILGVDDRLGSLEEGYIASFTVFTMPFLEEETQVFYSVSNGHITEFEVESTSDESEEE